MHFKRGRKVSKVEITKFSDKIFVGDTKKENELLRIAGNISLDFGKLLFAGVFIDRFFNSSEFTESFGTGFWAAIVIFFGVLGFLFIYLSVKTRR